MQAELSSIWQVVYGFRPAWDVFLLVSYRHKYIILIYIYTLGAMILYVPFKPAQLIDSITVGILLYIFMQNQRLILWLVFYLCSAAEILSFCLWTLRFPAKYNSCQNRGSITPQ